MGVILLAVVGNVGDGGVDVGFGVGNSTASARIRWCDALVEPFFARLDQQPSENLT